MVCLTYAVNGLVGTVKKIILHDYFASVFFTVALLCSLYLCRFIIGSLLQHNSTWKSKVPGSIPVR